MDKNLAGLLGAVSALAISAPSHATTVGPQDVDTALSASSYADLLKPIPNARALLAATSTEQDGEFDPEAVETVQYYHHHHHHHHHHHRWHRRWWHRHRPVVVIAPPY